MGEKGVTTFVTTTIWMKRSIVVDWPSSTREDHRPGTPSELKLKTLSQGVLEVECDLLVPALDLLKKEPWISESAVFGDGLHVIGKEGVDLEQEINVLFQKHGILLKRMDGSGLPWRMFLFHYRKRGEGVKPSVPGPLRKKSFFTSTGTQGV